MTITYPLVPPSVPGIRTSRLTANNIVAAATSPFTAEEEIQAFDGQWWSLEVGLPPMRRVLAEPWLSFLIGLGGRRGTFLMGDPDARAPRGSAPGSPVVDGSGQSGHRWRRGGGCRTPPARCWRATMSRSVPEGRHGCTRFWRTPTRMPWARPPWTCGRGCGARRWTTRPSPPRTASACSGWPATPRRGMPTPPASTVSPSKRGRPFDA